MLTRLRVLPGVESVTLMGNRIGTGWSRGIAWTDLEVRNGVSGQPRVLVCGGAKEAAVQRGIGDILISISHCRTYATAYALAVGPPAGAPGLPGDPPRE